MKGMGFEPLTAVHEIIHDKRSYNFNIEQYLTFLYVKTRN